MLQVIPLYAKCVEHFMFSAYIDSRICSWNTELLSFSSDSFGHNATIANVVRSYAILVGRSCVSNFALFK